MRRDWVACYSFLAPCGRTPETDKEIFLKPLPIRGAHKTGEFVHYMPGAEAGHWKSGLTIREQAARAQKAAQRNMPANWLRPDPRAPNHPGGAFMSSYKVRHPEAIHLPEYAGWHRKAQDDPTDKRGVPPINPSIWQQPKPAREVSRGPNYRVNENCGASWDPNARYGPETITAMPNADNAKKEALFDETADQKFDGIPSTGIHHFGSRAATGGYK
jgi:hypothetical protein